MYFLCVTMSPKGSGETAMKRFDEVYFVNYHTYEDLRLYEVGSFRCSPCYHYGPVVREHYVLHFIREGRGFLHMGGVDFPVQKDQAFITPPQELIYYEADSENPWDYIWIILNGKKAMDLFYEMGYSRKNPIYIPAYPCPEISQCMHFLLQNFHKEYQCIGTLYQLFHYLIASSSSRQEPVTSEDRILPYIRKIVNFISEKYAEPIKISDIANYCGLNRSYLTRIFKYATNDTPQEYLIHYRINKARELLTTTDLPIQHIARSVGYPDPFAFSKLFKKKTGLSPTDYRKK